MSITDELRAVAAKTECANGRCEKLYRGDLDCIANRIDAEHELAMAAAALIAGAPMTDEAMAEHGLVRLPKDADGEYIHIGDVMEWMYYDETNQLVIRTVSGVGADVFFAWSGANCQYGQYDAQAFRHHKQPTVEDVMVEFATDWESAQDGEDKTAVLKEYASKLRLVESEDE